LWTIPAFISLLYPYLIDKVTNKKVYKLSFWWTIGAVVLLSIIPEKKARYLVPVLIPLAINTGFYIQYLITNFPTLKPKKETLPVYFNFGLIAIIGISFPIIVYILLRDAITMHLTSYILTSIALVFISILILRNLYFKKINKVFYLTIFFMVSAITFGLPISKSLNQNTNYNAISTIHQYEEKYNINTYSIGKISPEMLWNYKGIIKNIYKKEELTIPKSSQFGLLMMNYNVKIITSLLKKNYTIQLIETYNFNMGSKMKERLIRQFYLVSKK
ncbi:MAG: hypothetical protein QM495_05995, partial [Lutibacter sp.]